MTLQKRYTETNHVIPAFVSRGHESVRALHDIVCGKINLQEGVPTIVVVVTPATILRGADSAAFLYLGENQGVRPCEGEESDEDEWGHLRLLVVVAVLASDGFYDFFANQGFVIVTAV
jgi:hypothetical protein